MLKSAFRFCYFYKYLKRCNRCTIHLQKFKATTSDLDYIMMWVLPTAIILTDTFNVWATPTHLMCISTSPKFGYLKIRTNDTLFDVLHIYYAYNCPTFAHSIYIIPIYSQILHIRLFVTPCFRVSQSDSTSIKKPSQKYPYTLIYRYLIFSNENIPPHPSIWE